MQNILASTTTHKHLFTAVSRNSKVGPIPVTTTSKDACDTSCAFFNNGCYADYGPLGMIWSKLTKTAVNETFKHGKAGIKALSYAAIMKLIKRLPKGTFWRHNQAGDLAGNGATIDPQALYELVDANTGKRGFTYTHKRLTPDNVALIRHANQNGFTVNVSANSARHAADLAKAYPDLPIVCVLPIEAETERVIVQDDLKILVCPATRPGSAITCAQCQACQKLDRHFAIGFPAHGAAKKSVSSIAGNV